jgi:hypothetical protein
MSSQSDRLSGHSASKLSDGSLSLDDAENLNRKVRGLLRLGCTKTRRYRGMVLATPIAAKPGEPKLRAR